LTESIENPEIGLRGLPAPGFLLSVHPFPVLIPGEI